MQQDPPDLERRVTELQAQINRLSLSLHLWHERQERLQPVEQRLTQLTDQCSEIVDRWMLTGERHAQMVGALEQRLSDWSDVEARVQQDASARILDLQRIIEHERDALTQMQDEPVKALRDQAAILTDICAAAATQAMSGFDRTETRLATLQSDLGDRLNGLSDQVQLAVAELIALTRRAPSAVAASAAAAPSWPLDGVVRLHNQLRGGEEGGETGDLPPASLQLLPEASEALSQRLETLERAVTNGQTERHEAAARATRSGRLWWAAVALLAIGIGTAAIAIQGLQREVVAATQRAADEQQRAQRVTETANQQIVAAREQAAREMDEAREAALKAQTISDVLAAPDLVRYNLVGNDRATSYSAQALWSRSRGLVFSGSRLPAPPPDSTYQIWILTGSDPVSVGTFSPDGSGRFTMATQIPPNVRPPIAGLAVTVERVGGSPRPTGLTLLARAEPRSSE